ncbi:recombinase family protein [Streptomyces rubiginosohelvolus]
MVSISRPPVHPDRDATRERRRVPPAEPTPLGRRVRHGGQPEENCPVTSFSGSPPLARRAPPPRTREHGHKLTKLFVEKAQSGTIAGDERPELAGALLWVEEKKVHGIVAPNLDRLARELLVQEAALAQCWKHGGRAFMTDQGEILPDDPEDPMRAAMRQMMGVFAQLDRGITVAKLRRGRRIKGEKGQYAYGAPPYGRTRPTGRRPCAHASGSS